MSGQDSCYNPKACQGHVCGKRDSQRQIWRPSQVVPPDEQGRSSALLSFISPSCHALICPTRPRTA